MFPFPNISRKIWFSQVTYSYVVSDVTHVCIGAAPGYAGYVIDPVIIVGM